MILTFISSGTVFIGRVFINGVSLIYVKTSRRKIVPVRCKIIPVFSKAVLSIII